MHWRTADRAEWAVDIAAAAIFAAAVGFAFQAVASGPAAATAAAAAFVIAQFGLGRIPAGEPTFALPAFPPETIEPAPAGGESADELILEDELIEVGPHARVVRLFGQSQSHLPSNHQRPAPPDASRALSEALAELRRAMQ